MGCSNSTLSRSSQINKSSKRHKIGHCLSATKSTSHAKNYHNNKNFSIFIATESVIHCKVFQEYLYLCTGLQVDQRGWKNLQALSLVKLDFTAELLRLYFDFQCRCWHFYDSGSGLLTEHIETSLVVFPSFFSLCYTKEHLLLFDKRCTPLP